MPKVCHTCQRDDVDEINKLLGAGKPLRYIVDNFKIPNGSIQRHRDNCLKKLFAEIIEVKRAGLLADVDEVKAEIDRTKADFIDNGPVRVQLIARRLDAIDKEARLTGAYTKDQENAQTVSDLAQEVVANLMKNGWDEADAQRFVAEKVPEISAAVN